MSESRQIRVIKAKERPIKTPEEYRREHQLLVMYDWIEEHFEKAKAHIERIEASRRQAA